MNNKAGIPIVPAPWMDMKAEAYSFYTYSKTAPTSAVYDPLERASSFADPNSSGHFQGGIGGIMIVRYKDSPCGPYDELVFIPGMYEVPRLREGTAHMRITRIYVSSPASTFNGRQNWNIPKRVAEFKFVPRTDGWPGYERIEVRLPNSEKPFFAVSLTPSWFSAAVLPANTKYLPVSTGLVQPPLPQGDEPERVGTESWQTIDPWMRGKVSPVWGAGGLNDGEWGDGVDFPTFKPFSLGVYWRELVLDFPKPTDPFASM